MNKQEYVKQVLKNMNGTKEDKNRVQLDLESDIESALEQGESWEDIESRLGDPIDLANEFNENLGVTPKKSHKKLWIGLGVVVVLLFVVGYILFPKTHRIEDSAIFQRADVEDKMIEVIEYFSNDDYDSIFKVSSQDFKEGVSESKLKEAKENLKMGNFEQVSNRMQCVENSTIQGKFAACEAVAQYDNTVVTYTMAFNEDLELTAFYVK